MNLRNQIKEYARLVRLKAMGVSTIAVVGALTVTENLDLRDFLVLFFIGAFFNMLGFVLNDYVDYELDKRSEELSERSLVKGTISKKIALIICILFYVLIYMFTILFYRNLLSMLFLTLALLFGTIYDCYGKKILGSDFILSGSIAFFCVFGATTQSANIEKLTIVICSIYFMHVLFFNIVEGGFKDADNDKKSNARTTAVFLGVSTKPKIFVPNSFKILAFFIEGSAASIVFLPFIFFHNVYDFVFWPIQFVIVLSITLSIFASIIKLFKMKIFFRKKVTMLITKQEVKRYLLIPLLMLSLSSIPWLIFVMILPILWYLSFVVIFRDKLFKSRLL